MKLNFHFDKPSDYEYCQRMLSENNVFYIRSGSNLQLSLDTSDISDLFLAMLMSRSKRRSKVSDD